MPLISVIIPTYNRADRVQDAVQSALEQTYSDFELIVVDDGSNEDLSIVSSLLESAGHRLIRIEHSGVSAARNFGVSQSSGKWLAFLDSDDRWLHQKLERQVAFHEQHPKLQISQCEEKWIRNGRFVNKREIHQMPDGEAFSRSLELCCISPSAVILRRDLFNTYGPFDEELPVCEDYDLWLKITADHQVGYLSEHLVVKHGGHADQLSRSEAAIDRFRIYSLLRLLSERSLSGEQQQLVINATKNKINILMTGAKKHSHDDVSLYEHLLNYLEDSENVQLIFPDMREKLTALIQKRKQ